jgi:hypothetical protein
MRRVEISLLRSIGHFESSRENAIKKEKSDHEKASCPDIAYAFRAHRGATRRGAIERRTATP